MMAIEIDPPAKLNAPTIAQVLKRSFTDRAPTPKVELVPVTAIDEVGRLQVKPPTLLETLWAWVYANIQAETASAFQGEIMNNKVWYASKTLWVNVLTIGWTFIGPLIGIPTLDPETMIAILGAVNLLLRIVTKGAVTISQD